MIAPIWPTQTWWESLIHMITGTCYLLPQPQDTLRLPHKPDQKPPLKKIRMSVFSLIWEALKRRKVSSEARELFIQSWRQSIRKQYGCYIKKWLHFCGQNKVPFHPTIIDILAFFVTLYQKGLKYRVFLTARAALNSFVNICGNINITDNILIKSFVQDVFVNRPSLPRYNSTWDVNIVLSYYSNFCNLTLLQLSHKLCILFLLVTAQRCQTLHLVNIQDVKFTDNGCVVKTPYLLKQSKPSHHLSDISISKFKRNTCV